MPLVETPVWRPAFVLLLGLWWFPRFTAWYWRAWWGALSGVLSLLVILLGCFLLVTDLIQLAHNKAAKEEARQAKVQ